MNKISNFHVPTRVNLEECLGSIISPDLLSCFVWFLFGRTAHNGKSFFLYLISQLLSDNFISTLSPHDVAKSQFKISEMYGKKVNLVDEVGDRTIPDFDKIKLLITGGLATIEFKGKGGFTVKLEVPQVFDNSSPFRLVESVYHFFGQTLNPDLGTPVLIKAYFLIVAYKFFKFLC
ncbi:primase-helicase family protein [Neobacillus bataviensis]|uniref:primase-helicase family protein n=1 Tax=Neobacillus bataviensis TaxID=220685 RepID=UPI0012FC9A0D|nr:primase-helicase family protein [Neobacillus bataviensis]